MDRNLLLFILLLATIYVGLMIFMWRVRRATRARDGDRQSDTRQSRRRDNALTTALLNDENATEHRVDAATREAEEGSRFCNMCKFSNFQRLRYCALCGTALQSTLDVLYTEARPADRLQRACRRKEWGRRVDVNGRTFWYRAAAPTKSNLTTGFVVQFLLAAPDRMFAGDDPRKTAVANQLAVECSTHRLVVIDAASADASVFPNGSHVDLASKTSDALQMGEKEFPTKYSHFVVCAASLLVPPEVEVLKVSVHRDYILEDSINHLSCVDVKHLRTLMRINFIKESGVDAGGVHREWFMLLSEMLVNPDVGLFKCMNEEDQTYYLNPTSETDNGPDHLAYFYAAGRLIGRALLEGDVLGFHLSTPLLKIILGVPVSFDDLESVDPVSFKSMVWLLQNDDVESLGLNFTVTESVGTEGNFRTVDLITNGADVAVTDANKHQYLERRLQYLLYESVSSQLFCFLKGIYEVVPQRLLTLFDPEEFDFVMCGSQDIDVADWQRNSKCSSNLTDSRVYRWFWEIVRDMPNEYRRRLLQFATGRSRVPLAGFKGLTSYDGRICLFTLKGVAYHKSQYIRSHACFNRLDLPMYPTREEMKKMIDGILSTDVHGFTIQ